MYLERRLWPHTEGVRARIAFATLIGLLAAGAGVARLALLGWLIAKVFAGAPVAEVPLVVLERLHLDQLPARVADHEHELVVDGRDAEDGHVLLVQLHGVLRGRHVNGRRHPGRRRERRRGRRGHALVLFRRGPRRPALAEELRCCHFEGASALCGF